MLSEVEKELILDLATQKIEIDEFYSLYPIDISCDSTYVLRMLKLAMTTKDATIIDYMFYLRGFRSNLEPLDIHIEILRKLLLENWHKGHEYIVDALESNVDERAITVLCERALGSLPHLDSLDNESLRKRCVYAISKIGGIKAIDVLKQLSENGTEEVQKVAIKKLKEQQPVG